MDSQTMTLIRSSIRGVAEVWDSPLGLAFSRLPAWTSLHHLHDALTDKVARQGSGVRLLLSTEATEITLTYRSYLDAHEVFENRQSSTVSLASQGHEESISHRNGNVRIWSGSPEPELILGEDSVAKFELPETSGPRTVSIWLPHACEIELVNLKANANVTPATVPGFRWTHYGSSISHCMEALNPLGVWPARVANDLDLDLYSLGLAGSCNLEQFAARTIADHESNLITLKLGINVVNGASMTERTFIAAVHAFLDTIRMKQPITPIVLISPIFCRGHENNPGPISYDESGLAVGRPLIDIDWVKELTLVRIREILAKVVVQREDPNLRYLDGLSLFSEADERLMPDGLHPNHKGYALMAERFKKLVFEQNEN